MFIPSRDIGRAIAAARQYSAEVGCSESGLRSADLLKQNVCKSHPKLDVVVLDLAESAHVVKGGLLAFKDGGYRIFLLRGLNFCWTRFVLTKELFHVILDSDDCRSMDLATHLAASTGVVVVEVQPSKATLQELLTEVAAMEFLFPHRSRVLAANDREDLGAIAERFRCPLSLVAKYMHPDNLKSLG